MRTRSISAAWIAIVGLLPLVFGGPVFALLLAALGILGYHEYLALARRLPNRPFAPATGYAAIAAFAVAGLLDEGSVLALAVSSIAVSAPLVAGLARADAAGTFAGWAVTAAGSLYLGLPIYAGVALRGTEGTVETDWLRDLAATAAIAWPDLPRGLAWALVVILCTWLGDTAAYLIGRSIGRRPLLPRVSPKKTVEGSLGGLAGAALVGGLGVSLFGLGLSPAVGLALGIVLGIVGQVADLGESLLKRQAGVKDSGTLIPGHGGVLDRIDALLFALPVGWFLTQLIDRAQA